ncbi:protein of unknown function UPF0157 [Beutenbergia cavernae DSM 12333]|uniref:GrpB family protein n=1 Tax=Beutenbergia cavernae (strain ATCC BAA-8 / DSM 12333 / CCUG 43141 / JCM 11478 / NBRC 16432 / NCIMB 13614 / HKI 0122) TaxID=471853 RepID=C5C5E0_BEUC1|nr:GrpB family protein [Beutenbergia cavernae]ACQ82280.1 protein of unknown function UPF0157 [Beutenbergia cavernae DSM 12333]
MPFPDEVAPVRVVPARAGWAAEGSELVASLDRALGPLAVAVDHIGSTSVPGLPAKDCLDAMVRASDLDGVADRLVALGYRLRPEPWNAEDVTWGEAWPKRVLAPAVGARRCNVHVRLPGSGSARYALLFRDYLRADAEARDAWGRFKLRLAASVPDIAGYGQIKQPATEVLMRGAEGWATRVGWTENRSEG